MKNLLKIPARRSAERAPDGVVRPTIPRAFLARARILRRAVGPVALLALWQVGSMTGIIPDRIIAAPGTIAVTLMEMTVSGELIGHLLVSLRRVGLGLGLGIVTGVLLAVAAGLFRVAEDLIDVPLQMLRTLPVLALIPLFILWFGIGETPKVLMVALGTLFPVYLNTFAGIRGVDGRLVETATAFGVRGWGLVRHVVLPGALPSALVGLRYALGIAWLVLVVSEQINASAGIGYLMMTAREFLRTDVIVVGLIVYSLLGLLTDQIVRLLERSMLSWRQGFSGS